MRFSRLLDITVGDHAHKEHLRYYPLADYTVGVDIRNNVLGKYDVDEFVTMDCENKLDFEDDSFDMVISDHTIEHLENPLQFYRELQRVGKKFIVILTPHWLADSMNRTQKKIFPKKETDARGHVYQFRPQWFRNYVNQQKWLIDVRFNYKPLTVLEKIIIPFPHVSEIEVTLRRRQP